MTATLNQIERDCVDLARDGHPITFVGIAQRTGTARSTLYRNPALGTRHSAPPSRSTAALLLTGRSPR